MMPGLTGYQLIEKIRRHSLEMPCILFSHLGKPEDRAHASEKNIVFMVKGLDSPKDILAHVQNMLAPKKSDDNHSEVLKNIKFNN
jgi:DNA-binding response OmpR family regulator